jgi:hypothetical protein
MIDAPDDYQSQRPLGETVKRMVNEVLFDDEYVPGLIDPETSEPYPPSPTLVMRPNVSDAFDAGAGVSAHTPTPARRSTSKKPSAKGGRPPGAEELQKLFAAGMILLIVFTVGEWAQPTAEEATELAAPLSNILARRIDIAAKLGADSNDVIAFTVAIMAYVVRVGPIAADKAKEAWEERNARSRVDRVQPAPIRDSRRTGSMATGSNDGTGSSAGASRSAFDALAEARATSIGSLDRDFGYLPGSDPTVARGDGG